MTINAAHSFAARHADPSLGFRAVPRWFRRTEFWQTLEGPHRAVLDELYHRIASEPITQKGTGIHLERGQWAISYEALAASSGTTKKQVRTGISRAENAGVIGHAVITKRLPGRTLHLSIFTWLDFDTYDVGAAPAGTPLGTSLGTSLGIPQGRVIHNWKTHVEDTIGKTQPEEIAADAAGLLSVPVSNGTYGFAPKVDPPTGPAPSVAIPPMVTTPDPATAMGASPAPASAKPRRPSKRATTAEPLADEEKAVVLSSADTMERYLLWGKNALRGVPEDQLRAEGTNWRRHNGTPEDPRLELWDIPSFAGYYWFRVCKFREKRGILLTLPQWNRLMGDLKNVLATMTKRDLHLYIGCVCSHFELIQWMCQRAGQTMALNETSLSHNLIKTTASILINMTDSQRGEKYAEMRRFFGIE